MEFDKIKKILAMSDDAAIRMEIVMDLGKNLSPVPNNAECTEIKGCASFVQICRAGNKFYGIADSMLVRGIVAIMISMVDGKSPDEIRKMDLAQMFSELKINVGASRLNGVNSMIRFFQNL